MSMDETILSQRKPAAPGPPPVPGAYIPPPDQPLRPIGRVVAVAVPGRINFRRLHVFGLMALIFGSIAVMITVMKLGAPKWAIFPLMILPAISGALYAFLMRQSARRRAERLAQRTSPEPTPADLALMIQAVRGFGARTGLQTYVRGLTKRGVFDRVLFAYPQNPKTDPPQFAPLDFPFEPQPLNETQSALMREQTTTTTKRRTSSAIGRNILLKGGWGLILAFGFNFGIAVLEAFERRNLRQPGLYTWGAALLLVLFVPVGMRFWDTRQWLLVPGGVLLRRARRGASEWDLTLYDRKNSLLLLAASRKGNYWVAVANAEQSDAAVITAVEAEFLVRAWISPLPPPPVEMLHELG